MTADTASLCLSPSAARAALLGLLIGDAVGVPYEFHPAHGLPPRALIDMQPPAGFRRSHSRVPAGTWSDDGALALALLDSLRQDPSLDLAHFSANMLAWFEKGRFTPDGKVFDVGMQTRASLFELRRGTAAERCGRSGEMDNGNGSLMRALPCTMVPFRDIAELVERAMRQSLPTHAHPRSQVVCALYVLVAWALGHRGLPRQAALSWAFDTLQPLLPGSHLSELEGVRKAAAKPPRGSGYVVDSFWSAWHALETSDDYADCIRRAIALGEDTDTTACIAGGLAGLVYGEEGLPAAWLDALRGRETALALLASRD